ncbi:hypothetical protein F8388_006079 [Cannabis sativa]|uniref:Ubiquitin-like protease family profile domain-containing protein n=1 Tax=Cannabis sativa TaxID=3483 RepID=A0A7J6H5K3_CANSA|nr:hypothetical protein F8388_006079 [Cannabis sativa]
MAGVKVGETAVRSELLYFVFWFSGSVSDLGVQYMSLTPLGSDLDDLSVSQKGSSYMAGKHKRKGGNEPVKTDVTPEPNDNAVAWRNFFNANYKALRAAEKGLTEKELSVIHRNCLTYFKILSMYSVVDATDKLKVQYKGFTNEEKSEWRNYDLNPTPAKKAVQTRGRKPKAADGKGKKVEVDEEEVARESEEASGQSLRQKRAAISLPSTCTPLGLPGTFATRTGQLSGSDSEIRLRRMCLAAPYSSSKQCKSAYKFVKDNGGPNSNNITLTSNPVILPNDYSDSEGRKSSDHFVSSINELKEYFSNELKSQLRSFSLKFMDKGEGVGGIDRELEEDAAAKVGKKAECSQAVEESPLKSLVRSKTNVVGLSEENVVESVTTPSLSASKSVEDEGAAHKTFDDDDFDIVEVVSFWNKGKALVKSKKTQSENVHLIEDDFNDKAYEQFIESGRTVVGPFKTKEAIPLTLITIESDMCLRNFKSLNWIGGAWHRCDPSEKWRDPLVRIAKEREWSKLFYEDNFQKCIKMFVPVLTLEGAPHWFGAELNMKSKVVSFLDSLHTAMDEKYRVDATKEMLSTLDLLFEENRSKNVTFVDFGIDRKDRGLPQQDNDRDCGV